jgi:hypothetical protein
MPTLQIEIATGPDDGFGFAEGGTHFDDSSGTAFFGNDGSSSHAFLRFILPTAELTGAVITSATMNLWMPGASGQATVNIYGDAENDPDAPLNWPDLSAIPYTTAFTPWTTVDQPDGIQPTSDFAAVMQELVDNYSMAAGDAIQIVLDGDAYGLLNARELATFESANPSAQLVIEYEAGVTTITSVYDGNSFVPVATSVWDGANWVPVVTKIWDGNTWVP